MTEFVEVIPHEFARRHLVLGVLLETGAELLVSESTPPDVIHNVGVRMGIVLATKPESDETIASLIDQAYESARADRSSSDDTLDHELPDIDDIEKLLAGADADLLQTSGKAAVVKLVDSLLLEAIRRGASDIHVQPLSDELQIRFRVDGLLHTAHTLNARLAPALVSRIKVMGRMDIAERRVPQDGRATVRIGDGHPVDLRISTLPTSHGERAVLRLLDNTARPELTRLSGLGMPEDVERAYLDRAGRSNGIILLTGPTGSGKTTTLYATLRWIAEQGSGELNVMTIEDPIEYELSGSGVAISQSQVNTKKGVTFASGLRHILRQDPDVVMVGEIRDAETARIAIQSSLTGHLVFSTLHTNDAVSAVTRLIDLGVEPYLISASLSAVLAQRLVRTTHQECAGKGCPVCFDGGLLGRIGLFELLLIEERVREMIASTAPIDEIRRVACDEGLRLLIDEGRRLIKEGISTEAEIRRVAWDRCGGSA